MTETLIQEADKAFSKQVSDQVARITSELNRMEQLLSAGQVNQGVLTEFRDAVNRVRSTGWQVQNWLEGDPRDLQVLLIEERIRVTTRLAVHLTAELGASGDPFVGLGSLKEAIHKLDGVLSPKA